VLTGGGEQLVDSGDATEQLARRHECSTNKEIFEQYGLGPEKKPFQKSRWKGKEEKEWLCFGLFVGANNS